MKHVSTFVFHVLTGRLRQAYEMLRHLRLGTQLAFIGLGVGSYLVHQYPSELWLYAERGYYTGRLMASPKAEGIALSRRAQQRLGELISTLQHDQIVELRRRNLGIGAGYNTWAIAQMSVGLGDANPVGAAELNQHFEKTLDEDCGCWRETPQSHPHTASTGWTIFAMSRLGLTTPPRVLGFILRAQSPEGWWALYPAKPEPVNAGSYPTAWAAMALCSQLPLQQQSQYPADLDRINFAIENALNWLSKNEVVQAARWIDYPANSPAIKSVSIAGLVVHTMRQCGYTEGVPALHRRWLSALPFGVTTAGTTEVSNTNLYLKNEGLEFDRTRHYVLQWALIATVDAYASGSTAQRAAAVQWIERILKPELLSPEVRSQRWVAAELLYALRHLRAHMGAARPEAK